MTVAAAGAATGRSLAARARAVDALGRIAEAATEWRPIIGWCSERADSITPTGPSANSITSRHKASCPGLPNGDRYAGMVAVTR